MKTLIVGNTGYVGPVLSNFLKHQNPERFVAGFDTAYYAHSLTADHQPERVLNMQHFGDVRDFPVDLLNGFDAIIYLAAISNDPMGKLFEDQTRDINQLAATKLARAAKNAGVSHFVFASSCSVYGCAGEYPRDESSELNPLTAYAHSKVNTENELLKIADKNFLVTCPRFATACGFSPRLRLDLVLNDFVASAMSTGTIEILSDGTPYRPLIHVQDMSRVLDWASKRSLEAGGEFLVVNSGSQNWNFQVLELAQAVQRHFPNVEISINRDAAPDKRSYQVDFSLLKRLAGDVYPRVTLDQAIIELKQGLTHMKFSDNQFRQSDLIRLHVLQGHIASERLDRNLYWK